MRTWLPLACQLDLLGIRALTVLADAAELVRAHHDPAFRLAAIPPEDAATAHAAGPGGDHRRLSM